MITVASLIACGIGPTQARAFADPLAAACALHAIDTPARVAGFVAQCRVESDNFTSLEEDLFYRTPERIRAVFASHVPSLGAAAALVKNPRALALAVYSDRLGNGGQETGDGWAFRGRGLLQTTGRANYAALNGKIDADNDFTSVPDLIAQPSWACLAAAFYWHRAGCNVLADSAQWDAITRAVNGPAMLQADLRRQYSEQGAEALA